MVSEPPVSNLKLSLLAIFKSTSLPSPLWPSPLKVTLPVTDALAPDRTSRMPFKITFSPAKVPEAPLANSIVPVPPTVTVPAVVKDAPDATAILLELVIVGVAVEVPVKARV